MGKNNNAESQANLDGGSENTTGAKAGETTSSDVKTTGLRKIKARTLTKKGHYYRAGLSFIVSFKEYEVSEEVLKGLKADKWLEVEVL